jgi:hypothetical protein
LKNGPLSHVPPIPDDLIFRDGSLITVCDEHGGLPLAPPSPTSRIIDDIVVVVVVTTVLSKHTAIKSINYNIIKKMYLSNVELSIISF